MNQCLTIFDQLNPQNKSKCAEMLDKLAYDAHVRLCESLKTKFNSVVAKMSKLADMFHEAYNLLRRQQDLLKSQSAALFHQSQESRSHISDVASTHEAGNMRSRFVISLRGQVSFFSIQLYCLAASFEFLETLVNADQPCTLLMAVAEFTDFKTKYLNDPDSLDERVRSRMSRLSRQLQTYNDQVSKMKPDQVQALNSWMAKVSLVFVENCQKVLAMGSALVNSTRVSHSNLLVQEAVIHVVILERISTYSMDNKCVSELLGPVHGFVRDPSSDQILDGLLASMKDSADHIAGVQDRSLLSDNIANISHIMRIVWTTSTVKGMLFALPTLLTTWKGIEKCVPHLPKDLFDAHTSRKYKTIVMDFFKKTLLELFARQSALVQATRELLLKDWAKTCNSLNVRLIKSMISQNHEPINKEQLACSIFGGLSGGFAQKSLCPGSLTQQRSSHSFGATEARCEPARAEEICLYN